jgi:uncharacterized protein YbaA (DUF1428 family)
MNTHKVGYIDGFVFVVPEEKVEAYKEMAEQAASARKKHGALAYTECQ